MTEEDLVFRVDLRLRPEGRKGAIVSSLDAIARTTRNGPAWERQAWIKARVCAGDPGGGRALPRDGPPLRLPAGPRRGDRRRGAEDEGRHRPSPCAARAARAATSASAWAAFGRWSSSSRPSSSSTGATTPGCASGTGLRAIFRLTERGYLSPGLGRFLGDALVHLRTVEHRLQILHEFQTHMLPEGEEELGRLARRTGIALPPACRAPPLPRRARARSRAACTGHFASSSRRRPPPPRPRSGIPSYTALKATGFAEPDRARQNLRLLLDGRPLTPYPAAARHALAMFPVVLDGLWQTPRPRRGAQPVRAPRRRRRPAHRVSRAARRAPRSADESASSSARAASSSRRCSSRSRSCSAPSPIPRPSPRRGARRSSEPSCRPC